MIYQGECEWKPYCENEAEKKVGDCFYCAPHARRVEALRSALKAGEFQRVESNGQKA